MSARGYLFDCVKMQVFLNNNRYSNKANDCVIVRSQKNLVERYGILGMVNLAEKLGIQVQDTWTSDNLSEAIWNRFKEITNEQIRDERRAKRQARGEVPREGGKRGNHTPGPRRVRWPRVYRISFEAIGEELRPLGHSRLPQQARTILDHLRQQPAGVLTEQEMKDFVQKLADDGKLTGHGGKPIKQDSWRIFSYYEATFHQYGLVIRDLIKELPA